MNNSSFDLLFTIGFLGFIIISLTGAGFGAALIGKGFVKFGDAGTDFRGRRKTDFIDKIIVFFGYVLGGLFCYGSGEMIIAIFLT